MGQLAAAVIVVAVVEALVLLVVLQHNPAATAAPPEPIMSSIPEDELRAPTVRLGDVYLAFPVDDTGEHMMRVVISAQLKLGRQVDENGRPKSESIDLDYLTNVYLPKVRELLPRAREMLRLAVTEYVERTGSVGYHDLYKPQTQQEIMENLREGINKELKKYGVEPRVVAIWCDQFTFE